MQRPLFFDAELESTFIALGAVKIALLAPAELQDLQHAFQQLRPADAFDPRTRRAQSPNQADYHCTFLDTDLDYRRQVQALIARSCGPQIARVLRGYRILTANIYVKPPGTGMFEIHQNWPTCPRFDQTSVTVWIPLQDVDAGNGGIHVVPGSHKIVPDIAALNAPAFFQDFAPALVDKYLQPVPLQAGQALVFCDSLLHWSPPNLSAAPRAAIQIELVPEEVSTVLYWLDRQRPQDGFEVFEVPSSFFTERSITDLMDRPQGLRSRGRLANPNRPLSESEFLQKLAQGPSTRASLYYRRDLSGCAIPPPGADALADAYAVQS